jgi:hypothetical protein
VPAHRVVIHRLRTKRAVACDRWPAAKVDVK